jgi:hypothetical protein
MRAIMSATVGQAAMAMLGGGEAGRPGGMLWEVRRAMRLVMRSGTTRAIMSATLWETAMVMLSGM